MLAKNFLILCVLMWLSMHNVLAAHVTITNNLEDNLDLTVHCKSRDDDLGPHLLRQGQNYGFKFTNNFWGTTLFFCSFQWNGEFRWFDIYKESRDYGICTSCDWFIKKSGPCLHRSELNPECSSWNK